jgi:tetratricopeptide (TPR) repeat protein
VTEPLLLFTPLQMVDLFDERLELARKLADERRFADAIVMFNWLCEAYPDRAAAVIDSAIAFSRVYDYNGVAMRFADVESRAIVPGEAWLAMAEISERLRRPLWTTRFLTNAANHIKPSANACGLFAIYLEHANKLDEASELVDRGLKIDPQDPSCQLAKGKVLRRQRSIVAAERAIREVVSNSVAAPRTLISGWYELAKLHDSQDDCKGAIEALAKAKELSVQQPEYAIVRQRAAISERNLHRFLTTVNEEYFKAVDQWKPKSPCRLALLGGHPRSGTTLLEQVLDSHTGIISAEETIIFGNGVNDPFIRELNGLNVSAAAISFSPERLELFRWAYFSTMESVLNEPIGDRLLVDKNPSYTDCIPVFARVFPEASYIIALRDPRDVVLSCFFQDLPINDVTIHFQTLKDTAMRYANTMAMWLVCRENMDERKWIEVRYESLVKDLGGETARVMNKLNLEIQPAQLQPDVHSKNKTVISPTYADVAQPVHSRAIGKWKRYEPWLGEALPILETFIEAFEY